ncbi:hypothetical protein HMPREF1557_00784, partial [Streptococcus sobrinus W1703]
NFVRNFFKKFHQLSKFAQRFPRNYQKLVFLMSSHKKTPACEIILSFKKIS